MDVVVVGVATQQTSLPVERFPIEFQSRQYLPGGITIEVGGAGYSVARHSARLGHRAFLVAPIGEDMAASSIDLVAERDGVNTSLCLRGLRRTPRSVVLTDEGGQRAVYSDLADVADARVDSPDVRHALRTSDVAVLGNLDLSRPLIPVARDAAVPVAVDLQDLRDPTEPELTDFLAADVLSMSNEHLRGEEDEAILELRDRGAHGVIVVTMGSEGLRILPAAGSGTETPAHVGVERVWPVMTTEGAGDVFLATFLDQLYSCKVAPVPAATAAAADTSRHLGGTTSPLTWFPSPQTPAEGINAESARRMGRPWVTGGF